mmetsp:Transcript_14827/g.10728  ORF Transcript_14827/g.10728 Transcript_14827/m.10728 type:complete len:217 (+) Transcript_14827:2699-3349(+)
MQQDNSHFKSLLPQVFGELRDTKSLTLQKLVWWELYAGVATVLMFYGAVFGMAPLQTPPSKGSVELDMYAQFFAAFTALVLAHAVMTVIFTRNLTYIQILLYILSLIIYYPVIIILNTAFPTSAQYKDSWTEFYELSYWLLVLLAVFASVIPYYVWLQYKKVFTPNQFDIMDSRMEKDGAIDGRWWLPMIDWVYPKRRNTYESVVKAADQLEVNRE